MDWKFIFEIAIGIFIGTIPLAFFLGYSISEDTRSYADRNVQHDIKSVLDRIRDILHDISKNIS